MNVLEKHTSWRTDKPRFMCLELPFCWVATFLLGRTDSWWGPSTWLIFHGCQALKHKSREGGCVAKDRIVQMGGTWSYNQHHCWKLLPPLTLGHKVLFKTIYVQLFLVLVHLNILRPSIKQDNNESKQKMKTINSLFYLPHALKFSWQSEL